MKAEPPDRITPLATDECPCGHMVIAHSASDGCVYCECDRRYRYPTVSPGRAASTRPRTPTTTTGSNR